MITMRKLEQEFQDEQEEKEVFAFSFNPDNSNHVKFIKFISRKLRDWGIGMACSHEKISTMTTARHINVSSESFIGGEE